MPRHEIVDHCPNCRRKNVLRALYCNWCGHRLADNRALKDDEGKSCLYTKIVHPISAGCLEIIKKAVLKKYEQERYSLFIDDGFRLFYH